MFLFFGGEHPLFSFFFQMCLREIHFFDRRTRMRRHCFRFIAALYIYNATSVRPAYGEQTFSLNRAIVVVLTKKTLSVRGCYCWASVTRLRSPSRLARPPKNRRHFDAQKRVNFAFCFVALRKYFPFCLPMLLQGQVTFLT